MANWILVGMKIGIVVVGLGAFVSGLTAAFASLATVPANVDTWSNGKLSLVADILYIVGAVLVIPMFFIAVFSLIAQLACKRMYESKIKMIGILHIVIVVLALLPFLFFPTGLILACGTLSINEEIGEDRGIQYSPANRPKTKEELAEEHVEYVKKTAQEHEDDARSFYRHRKRVFGSYDICSGWNDYDRWYSGSRGIFGRKGKDGKGKGRYSISDALTDSLRDDVSGYYAKESEAEKAAWKAKMEIKLTERRDCCLKGWKMSAVIVYMLAALIVMALSVVVFIFTKKDAKRMQQDALEATQAQQQPYYEEQPQPQYDPQYQEGQQGESYSVAPEGEVAA